MQNDVTYIAILVGLFALLFALVKICDLIIGADEVAWEESGSDAPPPEDLSATDDRVAA